MSPHVLRGAAFGAGLAAALAFAAPAMASYSATVDGSTLRLAGDGASDKVALFADSTTLVIDVGEDGTADFTFARSAFTAVSVTAGGGDDEVRLQGLLDGVTVDGGAGNDALFGGAGADTLLGGSGNDLIDGNQGADTLSAGTGNDTIQWDPGDGSDVVDRRRRHRHAELQRLQHRRGACRWWPTARTPASCATSRRSTWISRRSSRSTCARSAARTR